MTLAELYRTCRSFRILKGGRLLGLLCHRNFSSRNARLFYLVVWSREPSSFWACNWRKDLDVREVDPALHEVLLRVSNKNLNALPPPPCDSDSGLQ